MRLFVAGPVTKLKPMESGERNDTSPTEKVIVYTSALCTYCAAAKKLLQKLGVSYREVDLTRDHELRERLSRENGDYRTVPMIFVEGRFIGGYTDLSALVKAGGLAHLV
jgi:glutaredoxin 3